MRKGAGASVLTLVVGLPGALHAESPPPAAIEELQQGPSEGLRRALLRATPSGRDVASSAPLRPAAADAPPALRPWSRTVFWVGAAADLYSTKRLLETPGHHEANPLLARLGGDDALVLGTAALFKAATYVVLQRAARRGWISPGQANGLATGFGAGQVLVARHNLRLIAEP
jgi:hypothetical protein